MEHRGLGHNDGPRGEAIGSLQGGDIMDGDNAAFRDALDALVHRSEIVIVNFPSLLTS